MPSSVTSLFKLKAAKQHPVVGKCFAEMQTQTALALTAPYHIEEYNVLQTFIEEQAALGNRFDSMVAVGCGDLRYLEFARYHSMAYTAIEPNIIGQISPSRYNSVKNDAKVSLVEKKLEDVTAADLPKGKKLFLLMFNVFPYISNALNIQIGLMRKGDSMVISSWNEISFESAKLQKRYYNYLREVSSSSLTRKKFNGYLDRVENKLVTVAETSRFRNKVTDILTIKL